MDIFFLISFFMNIILLISCIIIYYRRDNSKDDYVEFESILKTVMFVIDTMIESTWKSELSMRIDKFKQPNNTQILNSEIKKETLIFIKEKSKGVISLLSPLLRKKIKKQFTPELIINFITTYLINGLDK